MTFLKFFLSLVLCSIFTGRAFADTSIFSELSGQTVIFDQESEKTGKFLIIEVSDQSVVYKRCLVEDASLLCSAVGHEITKQQFAEVIANMQDNLDSDHSKISRNWALAGAVIASVALTAYLKARPSVKPRYLRDQSLTDRAIAVIMKDATPKEVLTVGAIAYGVTAGLAGVVGAAAGQTYEFLTEPDNTLVVNQENLPLSNKSQGLVAEYLNDQPAVFMSTPSVDEMVLNISRLFILSAEYSNQ